MAVVTDSASTLVASWAVLDILTTGVLLTDLDGRVVHANAAACRLVPDAVGRHLSAVLVGDDPGLVEPDLERVRRHCCALHRSFVLEEGVTTRRIALTLDAVVADDVVTGFVAQVEDRGDVLDDPVLRNLLSDLTGDDPRQVTLLLDRSLRCIEVFGVDPTGLGVDVEHLTGRHVAVGIPEPLRASIVARHAAALTGETSEVEVLSPRDGNLFRLAVRPLRTATDIDGVVVTCRSSSAFRSPAPPPATGAEHVLRAGRVSVDLLTRHVAVDGRDGVVRLTGREFELLCDLIRHGGTARTREDLLSAVWGIDFPTSTSVVDVTMHRLRVKLRLEELQTVRANGLVFGAVGSHAA